MTDADGRIAAWATAWQCVESAQKYRQEVDRALAKARSVTTEDRQIAMQQYNCLMAEARVMSVLASVESDHVGIGAGAWLERVEKQRIAAAERTAQSFEDLMAPYEKPKPKDETDAES